MPNYPTHALWGQAGAVAVAVLLGSAVYTLLGAPVLAFAGAAGGAVATFVGAIYPDVDHHESIPRRKAVRGFRLLAALAVVGLAAANREAVLVLGESASASVPVPPVVAAVGTVGLGALVAAALVDPVIGLVTWEHRGWTHSASVNFVLVLALVAAAWALTAGRTTPERAVAVAVVAAFYLGTLVHLGLDGEIP